MRIGVLGGGQLGRMLALAGHPLGLRLRLLDPSPIAPAGPVGELVVGRYDDLEILRAFAEGVEAATWEFEGIPAGSARLVASRVPVSPPPRALEVAQDRLSEKSFFRRLGIPTPGFAPADSLEALEQALGQVGTPAVVKTRRGGYDGKGQTIVRHPGEAGRAWRALGGAAVLVEQFVPFDRELSIVAVRGRDRTTVFYPPTENRHHEGILRLSIAPAPALDPGVCTRAEEYARRLLDELNYVGALALELFQMGNRLLANEIAPRVHNSGHWTIEGAETSQFENHLRAVAGLPLGAGAARGHWAMANIVGETPDPRAVLGLPGARLHLYGKQPRPGRKVGHITIGAADEAELARRVGALDGLPGIGPVGRPTAAAHPAARRPSAPAITSPSAAI